MQTVIETAVKAPRKRAAKASTREDASKAKCTLHLSPEAAKRIGITAVMTGQSLSGVVESLVMEHLRRFVVSDRAKSADQVMESVSAV